jgi:hypothetical protein
MLILNGIFFFCSTTLSVLHQYSVYLHISHVRLPHYHTVLDDKLLGLRQFIFS